MFSLRTMLLVVAVVAVGIVGLTTRNIWWASVITTLTWATIAAMIVGAIVCRGARRYFSIGFGVTAGCYLLITLSLMFEPFTRTMVTNRLIGVAWRSLDVPRPEEGSDPYRYSESSQHEDVEEYAMLGYIVVGETGEMRQWARELRSFFIVGHCLWALLFGFLGALLANYLTRETPTGQAISRG